MVLPHHSGSWYCGEGKQTQKCQHALSMISLQGEVSHCFSMCERKFEINIFEKVAIMANLNYPLISFSSFLQKSSICSLNFS